MRRDLRAVLAAFVASHRGLRAGHVFGAPAIFAERRVVARLADGRLELRLPPATRAELLRASNESLRRGQPLGRPSVRPIRPRPVGPPSARTRRTPSSDWVTITSDSAAAERLEMWLEHAARHVVQG